MPSIFTNLSQRLAKKRDKTRRKRELKRNRQIEQDIHNEWISREPMRELITKIAHQQNLRRRNARPRLLPLSHIGGTRRRRHTKRSRTRRYRKKKNKA